MTIYSLCLRAQMGSCDQLQLSGGFDNPAHVYTFKIQCRGCDTKRTINVILQQPLISQCHICPQKATITAIPGHGHPRSSHHYSNNPRTNYSEMMRFEIKNATPREYTLGDGWEVKAHDKIVRIDLSSKDQKDFLTKDGQQFRITLRCAKFFELENGRFLTI